MGGKAATGQQEHEAALIPARMLNEWVYCPRLFYLMHVEGLMEANADVWQGRFRHAKRDRPTDRASRRKQPAGRKGDDGGEPEADVGPPDEWREATALTLKDERLGLVGKLDSVLLSGDLNP